MSSRTRSFEEREGSNSRRSWSWSTGGSPRPASRHGSAEILSSFLRYFEAFDAQGLQGTEHLRHPEIEYFDPPNLPDADRYVGEAAVRERLTRRVTELGWDGKFHVQEYLDAGDEVVVVWQLRGRSTHGLPFEGTFAYRCRFEDGKLRRQSMSPRLREHWTRAEALEAAGPRE